MNELSLRIQLYQDLIKLKDQQLRAEQRERNLSIKSEIVKGVSKPSFWLGLGFLLTSLMIIISLLFI